VEAQPSHTDGYVQNTPQSSAEKHFRSQSLSIQLQISTTRTHYKEVPAVIMVGFGIGIGDVLATINLAKKIRKEFIDAPSQFDAISDE
jgi:hypothetical protein